MSKRILSTIAALATLSIIFPGGVFCQDDKSRSAPLPSRGVCAHRGASATHPENTLSAICHAVQLGAHMVEFDVRLTSDGHIALMHDGTVDRTTNGRGSVVELTLAELRKLDAGSWKSQSFQGEPIPTLDEALAMVPRNIWLNIHLKGDTQLATKVAQKVVEANRQHQSILACGEAAAESARRVNQQILICNMDRQMTSEQYVNATIDSGADFIQLLGRRPTALNYIARLKEGGIRVNYCCTNDAATLQKLFAAGVEFPLVDRVDDMLRAAEQIGIDRVRTVMSDK